MNGNFDEIEHFFLALSDKTRIRLVGLMSDGEVSVNHLCDATGESQPKVSRHLAYLRTMGLVNTRREGKQIYYRLCEPESAFGSRLLRDSILWIASVTEGGPSTVDAKRPYPYQAAEIVEDTDKNDIYGKTDIMGNSEELEVYLL